MLTFFLVYLPTSIVFSMFLSEGSLPGALIGGWVTLYLTTLIENAVATEIDRVKYLPRSCRDYSHTTRALKETLDEKG